MNESLNNEDNRFKVTSYFPGLNREGFAVTSPEDPGYNCIAFAAGDTTRWWEPDPMYICYWHPEAPREYSLDAYCKAFSKLGYEPCEDGELEIGFEKVAFFVDSNGVPTHGARQTIKGSWLSKLGQIFDIEHTALDGVSGSSYGRAAVFMKRTVTLASV